MTLRDEVLSEVESFLQVNDQLGPSVFGREALGDPNFVRDLRAGRRIWPDTAERVRAFIRDYVKPPASSGSESRSAAA